MLSSSLKPSKPISHDHRKMAVSSPNPINFVEDALFCTGPFALSYTDPDQKWIIRQHLISLFQDFPSLAPAVDVFTHNDGVEVKLLNANGELAVARPGLPVPVTIWLHEFYPQIAPVVYVNVADLNYPIYENHPFVDSSGSITTAYLENWMFNKSDLSGLARNLSRIFSDIHPFYYSGGSGNPSHPSDVSRMEAMDRLAAAIYYDSAAIAGEREEEIEKLSRVQAELRRRAEVLEVVIEGLEEERRNLKGRAKEVWDERDKLLNWVKVYGEGSGVSAIDEAFEAVDRESEMMVEVTAADMAAEDAMYALDEAVAGGVLGFEAYMKQVRALAREQFLLRAKKVEIQRTNAFRCGRNVVMKTSWTGDNLPTRFYTCEMVASKYFEWHDPSICERSNEVNRILLQKINRMELEVTNDVGMKTEAKKIKDEYAKVGRRNRILLVLVLLSWLPFMLKVLL